MAKARLSALSVDDRGLLERWLSLQLLSADSNRQSRQRIALASIDVALASAIRRLMPQAQAFLDNGPAGACAA